ncbi:MAG: hypothetical protein ABI824_18385 [Acidobacteriota bacterium]
MLLEERHLYQQVSIDVEGSIAEWVAKAKPMGLVSGDPGLDRPHFSLSDKQLFQQGPGGALRSAVLTLIIENPKLFCTPCDEREVFRPVWYHDVLQTRRSNLEPDADYESTGVQLFCLTFQCQRCLGTPEAFMVKRDRWKLGLHGRSPMEFVEVPNYIPREDRDYFRDAIVAIHGGKTLAGLFYLRVFMERFTRRVIGETGRCSGDELMEAYYKGLPSVYRDQMPSFKEWYGKLSEPIHSGIANESLFEAAREALDRHFDMRRLFKIGDTPSRAGF